jgi:hypothetical protein
MARTNLLSRVAAVITGAPTSASITERLAKARLAVDEAQAAYQHSAVLAVQGDPSAHADEAEAAVANAERQVRQLEAALVQVTADEAARASADQAAADAKDDEKVIAALKVRDVKAKQLEITLARYVQDVEGLTAAETAVRAFKGQNPRIRPDLLNLSIADLTSKELGRLCNGKALVPGGSGLVSSGICGDPRTMQPFSFAFEQEAAAIRAGLTVTR